MSNPIAIERTVGRSKKDAEGNYTDETEPLWREVRVFCPGCKSMHPFRIEVYQTDHKRNDGSDWPTWDWNGSLTNPTFSPSLLCYNSVHICEGQHAPVTICDREFSECGHRGHGYVWVNAKGEQRSFKVYEKVPRGWKKHTSGGGAEDPHTADPAYGNCHSFLRNGVWEFLSDSAHHLAGQNVPLEPLPDWEVRD